MALACEQADCPIATEGRCLEGLPNGEGCPHLRTDDSSSADGDATAVADNGENPDAEAEQLQSPEASGEEDEEQLVQLSGGESLSVVEAHDAAAEYGARVVLLAGEFEAGKTTLIVELYARFLHGSFAGWMFGGSQTLIALDGRHFPTRYRSGREIPATDRTQPEHEGLLHLRLSQGSRHVALFLADMRGERFEHIIDGVPVQEELPLAHRADRTMILVDGAKLADATLRQDAIQRARLLIGGLTDESGLAPDRPLAIAITKRDLVDEPGLAWFDEKAAELSTFATERGARPMVMHVAARPEDASETPQNLAEVLDWMTAEGEPGLPKVGFASQPDDRLFWRFSSGEDVG